MTEIVDQVAAAPSGDLHTSAEARRRLAKRYSAEARFKYYGLAAVLAAALFLVLLLSTIVSQGLPAFTHSYVSLPIDLSAEKVDPNDPGAADYNAIIRDGLKAEAPFAGDRRNRKVLYSLVSSGANIILRNEVLDASDMLGTSQARPVPLSDFADLYVKGLITDTATTDGQGAASPVGTEGSVRILSTSSDFQAILAEVKADLAARANALSRDIEAKGRSARSLEASVAALEQRAASADASARPAIERELESARSALASVNSQIDSLKGEAAGLTARANAVNEPETMTTNLPSYLVEINGGVVKVEKVDATSIEGTAFVPLASEAEAGAGGWSIKRIDTPEAERKFSDQEIAYTDFLAEKGLIETSLNTIFFTSGASREPEMAGIWGAVVGSFYTMLVTLLLSFPVGVAAAIYLEEFAPKNRITHLIEVNINNLAAVPSIVFGLLGLAVFLNVFGLPRSAPVVGGMVLALMTLPTIIIAARAALKAVPPSIREAALGIGASRLQTVFHHVLPLAMPGIFTGTIIGMAQALGETAPLLMIGMVAFIVDIPGGPLDPATVLPVQIYMWADFPEPAFQQKTSAAIMVLLGFLIAMNAIAIVLRKRFERRW
ncbi:phosphate ABC transporter permease PstA [Stappia sp. F7233]|uniref:Phosphate transport system permease protein PstA n=1 Tax=Stappia albiluteola TaxID=2758565 RepID=A0A839AJ93_9HYPH|nr:phosphate ABC transporter permease PstA [Stappia albiluteola]